MKNTGDENCDKKKHDSSYRSIFIIIFVYTSTSCINSAELLHDEKVKAEIYTKANLVDSSSILCTAEQLKKAILRNIEE